MKRLSINIPDSRKTMLAEMSGEFGVTETAIIITLLALADRWRIEIAEGRVLTFVSRSENVGREVLFPW